MLAVQSGYCFITAVVLQAQGADTILQFRGVGQLWQMGEETLIELLHLLLEVSEDEDDIVPPEHDIEASYIIHEEEEIEEVVR